MPRFSLLLSLLATLLSAHTALASPELHVEGRSFVSRDGRTVILRGVNLSGAAKVAPYDPLPNFPDGGSVARLAGDDDLKRLAPLRQWGLNALRLVFVWDAYEPAPGHYNDAYLERIARLCEAAWSLGLYTVVDMHQDSFSRYVGGGCGIGFPGWLTGITAAEGSSLVAKDCGTLWAVKSAFDPGMHSAYKRFFHNTNGARDHFITAWRQVARRLRDVPGVIGYDLINEPWGSEPHELMPLYNDLARAIREADPTAIVFFEPQLLTVLGTKFTTTLPKPTFDNAAYAPHFYDAVAAATLHYLRGNPLTDLVFKRLPRQAAKWDVPLFLGEFGAYAKTIGAERYVDHQYEMLDAALGSGTQWNYTPTWNPKTKDGWNNEDYSIVDDQGRLRPNFKVRPYPRSIAGRPTAFRVVRDSSQRVLTVSVSWSNDPRAGGGQTEIFLPWRTIFGSATPPLIAVNGAGLSCEFSSDEQLLVCRSQAEGQMTVNVLSLDR